MVEAEARPEDGPFHREEDAMTAKTDHAEPGHNSGGIAADRLRSIVERIERLEEERKALGSDIKDIYAEAKSAGFDVKVLRMLIAERRKEPSEVEEAETLLEVYRRALGQLVGTPLADAALGAAAVRGARG